MIAGIGTDIVEIVRIAELYEKRQSQFVERILSPEEQKEFDSQMHPAKYLAKRWAAKEAVSKALGTGFSQGVAFNDITIGHLSTGQPIIQLAGRTQEIAREKGIAHWSISVSDETHYAVAFVVAEKKSP